MKIHPAPASESWPAFEDGRWPTFSAGRSIGKREPLQAAFRFERNAGTVFCLQPGARAVQPHPGAGRDFDVDFRARLDSSNHQMSGVSKENVVVSFFAI